MKAFSKASVEFGLELSDQGSSCAVRGAIHYLHFDAHNIKTEAPYKSREITADNQDTRPVSPAQYQKDTL